jgi:hypothetical protein
MEEHRIAGSNFTFRGARIANLLSTEYTLVTIAIDVTGSTRLFASQLLETLRTTIKGCKKSPRADNLLVRVIIFSDAFPGGIMELHGFKKVMDIDPDKDYQDLDPGGLTPLYDAAFSAVGATLAYGKFLLGKDIFNVNGIVYLITDGDDNTSVSTPKMVRDEIDKAVIGEQIESLVTVLVGINTAQCGSFLENFRQEAGITQYLDVGDVTPGKLAKLGGIISQSVSSQSMALGKGVASQNIPASF